ncbi:MAG TPA: ABC transporter permease [Acidobacteria bacterium]|nr:ABC transporter permease [Acidobacteriota bacterium]
MSRWFGLALLAGRSLKLHLLRSFLTALGIIIGVGAVIYMLAFVEGGAQRAQARIRARGATNIMLRAKKPVLSDGQSSQRMVTYGLSYDDATRIRESFADVEVITPVREVNEKISWADHRVDSVALGTVPWYPEVARVTLASGSWFHQIHMKPPRAVCVVGAKLAKKLFQYRDPLGLTVRIGTSRFRVIGVLNPVTNTEGPDQTKIDLGAFIPMTTVLQHFGDRNVKQGQGSLDIEKVELHQILVRVRNTDSVLGVAEGITAMLKRYHTQMDYEIEVPLALLEEAEKDAKEAAIQFGAIAAISLLVGGIGIMNIMLASVTERTREIGVRRALGALRIDITLQFVMEALILSIFGGLAGILAGFAAAWFHESYYGEPTIVTPISVIMSFGFAAAVGVIAGVYPAIRASRMDPIRALRHE